MTSTTHTDVTVVETDSGQPPYMDTLVDARPPGGMDPELLSVDARNSSAPIAANTAGLIPAKRNAFAKRTLDVIVALTVLAVTLPFYPLIILAIRLNSEGPAIFRQVRIGRNGRQFMMYKFRSMFISQQTVDPVYEKIAQNWIAGIPVADGIPAADQHDAHEPARSATLVDSLPTSDTNSSSGRRKRPTAHYKLANDPRITRIGRILRSTSIDELPQFINVLRGEMSVVGPRPGIPFEVEHYSEREFGRLLVNPGITGRWQTIGRGKVTFRQMIEMDLEYVALNSFWQDVLLIIRTIPTVLRAKGAA